MNSPTEIKLNYETAAVKTVGNVTDQVCNLVRDYAAVNRHDMMSTTNSGTPYVYRCAVTISPVERLNDGHAAAFFGANELQTGEQGAETTYSLDNLEYRLIVKGVGNNWVYREGSEKLHDAREAMFRSAGVKKKERGAYDKHIRYCWSTDGESYLSPLNASGSAFTGGNWEKSLLIFPEDANGAHIKLQGNHTTEETATAHVTLSLPQLYLSSRKQVRADSNDDVSDQPAEFSVLRKLLMPNYMGGTVPAEIVNLARDNQDNPPYDLDQLGDATESRELARTHIGQRSGIQSTVIVDIPFGICAFEVQAFNRADAEDSEDVSPVHIGVELLQIYEMQ